MLSFWDTFMKKKYMTNTMKIIIPKSEVANMFIKQLFIK